MKFTTLPVGNYWSRSFCLWLQNDLVDWKLKTIVMYARLTFHINYVCGAETQIPASPYKGFGLQPSKIIGLRLHSPGSYGHSQNSSIKLSVKVIEINFFCCSFIKLQNFMSLYLESIVFLHCFIAQAVQQVKSKCRQTPFAENLQTI